MRKYQYKESRIFAQLLGKVHALQVRQECAVRVFSGPITLLRYKMKFYWLMLKFRWLLEKGKRIDFYSRADYLRLRDMWRNIFKRIYEPKY